MGNMWAKKPLKEIMRENKRMITRAIRELDRERVNLERNEKKLIMDIKKYAKENQMGAVKTMAKDLVRTRNYQTKFIEMRSHLQGAALKLETVRSHEAMATAMRSVTSAMVSMNKQVNVPALTKIMTDFARENEKSELMGDMLGDAMDDAMTEEGDEEEQERIVGAVLTELGLDMTDAVPEAPGAVPASAAAAAKVNPQREMQALGGGSGGGPGGGEGEGRWTRR
ncbi:charged multivesicular body protein [Nannochloropsis oceanica]